MTALTFTDRGLLLLDGQPIRIVSEWEQRAWVAVARQFPGFQRAWESLQKTRGRRR